MKYELLALYEEFKKYIQETTVKNWWEDWEDYYTLASFMSWIAVKDDLAQPTTQSIKES